MAEPLILSLADGTEFALDEYELRGSFAIHETLGNPGFTVTHLRTGKSIIQGVPSAELCEFICEELNGCSPKWDSVTDLSKLNQFLSHRHEYFVKCLLADVMNSEEWREAAARQSTE